MHQVTSPSGTMLRHAGPSKREGGILVRALHNKEENKGCETSCLVAHFSFQMLLFLFVALK